MVVGESRPGDEWKILLKFIPFLSVPTTEVLIKIY